MNTVERLVYMANQIAANLATDEDPVAAVANHIRQFWDPRMKDLIYSYGGDGLSQIAARAVQQLAESQNAD